MRGNVTSPGSTSSSGQPGDEPAQPGQAWLIRGARPLGGAATDFVLRDGVIIETGPGLAAAGAQLLNADGLIALPEHAIVMHPGPMNRGVEIAAEVADSARSTIVEQVANGVSVRMAVLYLLLGGLEEGQ